MVVRLSDRAGGEFRARRLTASWAQDLERHEAAWCLWWPDSASVREGAPGDPAHLMGGDRLALLAWLVRHTSFGHFLFVDDEVLWQHVENLAPGRQRHRFCGIDGSPHVVPGDLAVLAGHRHDTATVEALDMWA